MRKLERRANICLLLAASLFIGILIFTWRFVTKGQDWASFYGNRQIYTNGEVNRGTIYDRNGVMLLNCTKDGLVYPSDASLRRQLYMRLEIQRAILRQVQSTYLDRSS